MNGRSGEGSRREPPAALLERLQNRLAIDRDGSWRFDGRPMVHQRTVRMLFEHMTRDDDGRLVVVVPPFTSYVDVEDTPYVVQNVRFVTGGAVELHLQDDSTEALDPSTLVIGNHGALYARVKADREEARFRRGPHFDLASRFRETPDGFVLTVEGRDHLIGQR